MPKEKEKKKNTLSIPADYLLALADKLHRTNPTKAIIYNTLKDLYVVAFDKGYFRRIYEAKTFKDAMNKLKKKSFDIIKDNIDDEIHSKPKQ